MLLDPCRRTRFEIANQHRQGDCGMEVRQDMNVVLDPSHAIQVAVLAFQNPLQIPEDLLADTGRKHRRPILGGEDDVVVDLRIGHGGDAVPR